LNKAGISISEGPISPERASQLISLVITNVISGKIAKDLTDIMWDDARHPDAIVEQQGLKQLTDESAIEAAVEQVIAANPDKVEEVKAKPKLAGWFVGQVMKATAGKANPQAVNAILKRRLGLSDNK
jgi:aspartyl-tRNA(Asn)/glutamyl-tRNA(Gln) amidotransferase subunit B